jgi:hypothetical protein
MASHEAPGNPYAVSDDRHHLYNARARMKALSEQIRSDTPRVADTGARALLEASVGVLTGLINTLGSYEERPRTPWRRA